MELGLALAICAVATGILFLVPPLKFLQSVLFTTFNKNYLADIDKWSILDKHFWMLLNPDTWTVLMLVVFILILSSSMKKAGALDDLVGSVRSMFIDNRFTIGALPAMIGLLPMPGGALFSAPMIDGLADEAELSKEDRTFLNYWFRHVWEYCYPLYPGLILESAIIGVDLSRLTAYQFPLSLAAILGGSIFGLLRVRKHFKPFLRGPELRVQLVRFLKGFWPILLIIIGLMGFRIGTFVFKPPFLLVLLIVVVLFGIIRIGPRKFPLLALRSLDYKLIGTIYAVLVFKDIILASGAVTELEHVFQQWGVPPIAAFMILPLLIGYLTGITHSYVSVAFPLLLPFFMGPGGEIDLAKVQLAYSFGFIGIILSPVHLCLVLSTKYYKSNMNEVYKRMIPPIVVLALVSLAVYFVLKT